MPLLLQEEAVSEGGIYNIQLQLGSVTYHFGLLSISLVLIPNLVMWMHLGMMECHATVFGTSFLE